MAKRALDLAKLIFEAEPDAAIGDPAAVEKVTLALAKINGAILATTLVRQGESTTRSYRRVLGSAALAAAPLASQLPDASSFSRAMRPYARITSLE